jgi:hypothetical protein
MKLPNMNPSESQQDGPGKPASKWNSILTATPVILTVLATLMAGLSNSEMTLAQYHRSLAAQNQSKAGDQWNFFQAKRIRGTNLEMTIDLLHVSSQPGPCDAAVLESSCDRLLQEFRRALPAAAKLGSAGASLQPAGGSLQQKAAKVAEVAQNSMKTTEQARDRIHQELGRPDAQEALACLNSGKLPAVSISRADDGTIVQALRAIRERRSEGDTMAIVRQIPDEAIQHAIEITEANVQTVEQADKPVSDALARIDGLIQDQVAAGRRFVRAVRELEEALDDLAPASKSSTEVQAATATLTRCAANARRIGDDLGLDFKAGQHGYTARRYEREARCNEEAAALYEVQVRKNSFSSERHRLRSKHFFYGMLAAQAGVTIGTFSLALKHKSVLWSLASLAGLGAILFGLYVYLYV